MRNLTMLLALSAVMMLASCGKKQTTDDIILPPDPQPVKQMETQRMEDTDYEDVIEWNDARYTVQIQRRVDTSLNKATDETGIEYYDNSITVKVLRQDGSTFFNRTFHKSDFNQYLDENTRKTGALLGLMPSKTEAGSLVFEGSVGSPDAMSENFIPLVISINRQGQISVSRATTIDTTSQEEDMP